MQTGPASGRGSYAEQQRTPPHVQVLLRFAFLGTCALNVFLVPGVHGFLPMPAPNIVVFPQEVSLSREWGQIRRYPDSAEAAEIAILPELLASALATLLWARLASPKFWRRGWIAFLLASGAGIGSRIVVPLTASIWWLPFSTSTFRLLLGIAVAALLVAAAMQEKRRSAR
jgi:hypothetical protein